MPITAFRFCADPLRCYSHLCGSTAGLFGSGQCCAPGISFPSIALPVLFFSLRFKALLNPSTAVPCAAVHCFSAALPFHALQRHPRRAHPMRVVTKPFRSTSHQSCAPPLAFPFRALNASPCLGLSLPIAAFPLLSERCCAHPMPINALKCFSPALPFPSLPSGTISMLRSSQLFHSCSVLFHARLNRSSAVPFGHHTAFPSPCRSNQRIAILSQSNA